MTYLLVDFKHAFNLLQVLFKIYMARARILAILLAQSGASHIRIYLTINGLRALNLIKA
jgi:hypothetical protein